MKLTNCVCLGRIRKVSLTFIFAHCNELYAKHLVIKGTREELVTILLSEKPLPLSHTPPQVLAMILLTWLLLFRVVLRPLSWSHGEQTGFKPVLPSSASGLPCGLQPGWTGAGSGGHIQLMLNCNLILPCLWQTSFKGDRGTQCELGSVISRTQEKVHIEAVGSTATPR